MDDQLQRKISRQLRLLNIMLVTFSLIIISGLIAVGFLLLQIITVARQASEQVDQLRADASKQLDVQSQLCGDGDSGDGSGLSTFLRNQTDICR